MASPNAAVRLALLRRNVHAGYSKQKRPPGGERFLTHCLRSGFTLTSTKLSRCRQLNPSPNHQASSRNRDPFEPSSSSSPLAELRFGSWGDINLNRYG